MKTVFDQDGIRLIHGDALAIAGELRADVMLTDPPVELAPADLGAIPGVRLIAILANVAAVDDWTRWARPHAATIWRRPLPTKAGIPFDLMLSFGWRPVRGFVDDSDPARATDHPAERGLKNWGDVMVDMALASGLGAPPVFIDPFAGSGTTLVAAREVGFRAIGIESDERWTEAAIGRLT